MVILDNTKYQLEIVKEEGWRIGPIETGTQEREQFSSNQVPFHYRWNWKEAWEDFKLMSTDADKEMMWKVYTE